MARIVDKMTVGTKIYLKNIKLNIFHFVVMSTDIEQHETMTQEDTVATRRAEHILSPTNHC